MDKEQHIRMVGWLYIGYGALMLLGGVGTLIACVASGLFSGNLVETVVTPIVGVVVMLTLFIFSLPSLLIGKGLLDGKSWARMLAMVLAVFTFFNFPLGTALCVYTYWVLWGQEADPYFEGRYSSYHERHQFR
jgi:hypothetical protein